MRWEILSKSKKGIASIAGIVDLLLKNRKIKDQKEFFNPTLPQKLTLKELGINKSEMGKAISRIKKALKNKEKVIIYGDYDADGICGTAILWETLYSLGLKVLPYLPERFTEGYGLNANTVGKLKTEDEKLKLIITVDNGVVAYNGIKKAKELGIDVIVTDHHQIGKTQPQAYGVVHSSKVSGSALAWILSRELGRKEGLELAAIGTIADQLPLTGANRSFVKYGLQELNKTERPGLLALMEESGLRRGYGGQVGTYEVGYIIAPRLNAMGRLIHAIDSLRLLCVKNKTRATELARHLHQTNLERQKIVDNVVLHALRKTSLDKTRDKQGIIVVASESYHEGVIGLAAAKLVDEFYRPAIVLSKKGEISKASARSISGFNIIEVIRQLEDLYIEGGGHPMAAGFSIETIKIQEFTEKINKIAKPLLTAEILAKKLKIDLELHFNQLNYDLYHQLKEFEPSGLGNPTPTFVAKGVEVINARKVGQDAKHLKLKLQQKFVIIDAIAFGFGDLFAKITPDTKVDIVYTLEDNSWNGRKSLQLKIKDLRFN